MTIGIVRFVRFGARFGRPVADRSPGRVMTRHPAGGDCATMGHVTMGDITQVPVTDLPDDFTGKTDSIMLDVREDDEWANGHIRGALHIPLAEIPARLDEIDPDTDLYVVCHSSGRSMRVLQYLAQVGYDGMCVRGGMLAWQEHGKPVEYGSGEPEVDAHR